MVHFLWKSAQTEGVNIFLIFIIYLKKLNDYITILLKLASLHMFTWSGITFNDIATNEGKN